MKRRIGNLLSAITTKLVLEGNKFVSQLEKTTLSPIFSKKGLNKKKEAIIQQSVI